MNKIEIKTLPERELIERLADECRDIILYYQTDIENGLLLDHLEDTINMIVNPEYKSEYE